MATDAQLIQRIQQGDDEGFRLLFQKYYPRIYSSCLFQLKNPQDAEEVTADTFMQAYLKLEQLEKPDKFLPWLKRIAQNRCTDFLRRQRQEAIPLAAATEHPSPQLSPDESLLKQELVEAIMNAIESLPRKDREVIRAFCDGLSHAEISERFGISMEASKSRLYRVRKQLMAQVRDLLHAVIGLPRIFSSGQSCIGGMLIMKTKQVVISSLIILLLVGVGIWVWHSPVLLKRNGETSETQRNHLAESTGSSKLAIGKTDRLSSAKSPTSAETKPSSDESRSTPKQPMMESSFEASTQETAEKLSEAKGEKESGLSAEEIQQTYSILGETFQLLKGTWDELDSSDSKYLQNVRSIPPRSDEGLAYRIDHFVEQYNIKGEWIKTFELIEKMVPGATKVEFRQTGSFKRHAYIIHRDVIESALGPMPPQVENAFQWMAEKDGKTGGVAFWHPSEAEFQEDLARLRAEYQSRR